VINKIKQILYEYSDVDLEDELSRELVAIQVYRVVKEELNKDNPGRGL
tara:strand:- start:260 stop:403 length:144 start_codon:yes stop_codon:yes gene_type:complete